MAKRQYSLLSQERQHDTLVDFHHATEADHHSHVVNEERYVRMLETLPPGAFRARLEDLLAQTRDRLQEVEAILEATKTQLPAGQALSDARARLEARLAAVLPSNVVPPQK